MKKIISSAVSIIFLTTVLSSSGMKQSPKILESEPLFLQEEQKLNFTRINKLKTSYWKHLLQKKENKLFISKIIDYAEFDNWGPLLKATLQADDTELNYAIAHHPRFKLAQNNQAGELVKLALTYNLQKHQAIALKIIQDPAFKSWKSTLDIAMQRNLKDLVFKILEHPQFDLKRLKLYHRKKFFKLALKREYFTIIKTLIQVAQDDFNYLLLKTFNTILNKRTNKHKILSFFNNALETGNLIFTSNNNTLSISISNPALKPLEITLFYNLDTKAPSKISTFNNILTFAYPPEKHDEKTLFSKIIEYPSIKVAIDQSCQEKDALNKRIEFMGEVPQVKIETSERIVIIPGEWEESEKKMIRYPKIFEK